MCLGVVPSRFGAYLPRVSAPPLPAKLWHIAQLVRKIVAPLEGSPLAGSTASADGIAGPGPRLATYADSCATSSGVNRLWPSGACGAVRCNGIRPVPTWKSTEAAPTPTSDGASLRPVASIPWHVAQLARNSARPASTCCSGVSAAPARPGARAAYATPVTIRPSSTSTRLASGERRRAASAVTIALLVARGLGVGAASFEDVDDEEQADPDHVDEVPVVRGHDGAGRLGVAEALHGEDAAEDEQEGEEPTGHVRGVEPGRQVEDRPVPVRRDRVPLLDEPHVLVHLAADEQGPGDVGEDEPLPKAPGPQPVFAGPDLPPAVRPRGRLDPLGREHAHLTPDGAQHQVQRVHRGVRDVELRRLSGPQLRTDRPDGEVHREEPGEEHQLAGQPDDGAHLHHVGPVHTDVRLRGLGQGSGRHGRHYCPTWSSAPWGALAPRGVVRTWPATVLRGGPRVRSRPHRTECSPRTLRALHQPRSTSS